MPKFPVTDDVTAEANFRWRAKFGMFTYSQAENLSRDIIQEFFEEKTGATKWFIAEELHKDGGKHFHAAIGWKDKPDWTDVKKFDIDGKHPNCRPCGKKDEKGQYKDGRKNFMTVIEKYCMKNGTWLTNIEFCSNWRTFPKDNSALKKFKRAMINRAKKSPWPMEIDGVVVIPGDVVHVPWNRWEEFEKKNCGKRMFYAHDENMWEGYDDEEVIVYQDPPCGRIIAKVAKVEYGDVKFPGGDRFEHVLKPVGVKLTQIIRDKPVDEEPKKAYDVSTTITASGVTLKRIKFKV